MARTTTSSSSRVGGSTRLTKLHSYYQNETHVWDIGCDHGYLGSSFKDIETVKSIQLVDPSMPVVENLKDSYISVPKVFIHHNEGQKLIINSPSNLIFIAGMGGKEIGEIILNLLPQLDVSSRLIISPHRKIIELRTLLSELPLSLISEEVIEEDQQFYQILELTPNPNGMKVPVFGEQLWASDIGEKYRNHQLKHYKAHKDLASQEYVGYLETLNPLKTTTK
jgi:tRNA (adenine22-N1)-methyltransferase